jgi:hypothetical protein
MLQDGMASLAVETSQRAAQILAAIVMQGKKVAGVVMGVVMLCSMQRRWAGK